MYYSITFGDKNTWWDWHIVPTSRPLVNPPEVKTEYVDIPGANGALDYTEAFGVRYKNREGSWEFMVMNGYQEWHVLYSEIMDYLHGKSMRVQLESEPGYFYKGRFFVDSWKSGDHYSTVTIRYIMDPYRYPSDSTEFEDWKWNDLFDLIIYYGTFDVMGTKYRDLINPKSTSITPAIRCSSPMTVTFNGSTYHLPAGTSKLISISPGDNIMVFTGTGRVVVDYSIGSGL